MPTRGFALVNALAAALRDREGLEGVLIATSDQDAWEEPDSIAIGSFQVEQGFRGMRGPGAFTTEEDGRLRFGVNVRRDGAGEELAVTIRGRLEALLAEIETCLAQDPDVADAVAWARLSSADLDQGTGPDGLWAQITGEVSFKSHF